MNYRINSHPDTLDQAYESIGEYKHYIFCRFCFSKNLTPILNLGYVPLAGGFLKTPNTPEFYFPLDISFCNNCYLLQSVNVIDKDLLFKNYFYHTSVSKTLVDHFNEISDEISTRLSKTKNPLVVEIGCNDGSLITSLTNKKIHAIGVDPAENIVKPLIKKKFPIINKYFTENVAEDMVKQYGKADIICGFNVFAHIEDMHDVMKGVKKLLKNNGIFMFEVHYLGNLIEEVQYDMIYHEHQYYYSLLTLQNFFERFGMEVFDVQPVSIHAGSMRYYVKLKTNTLFPVTKKVKDLAKKEKNALFTKPETFIAFSKKVEKSKKDLLTLLIKLKKEAKTIVGYGASGRGTIISNYCGLDEKYLDYVIDDSPAKQHAFTPGTHREIKDASFLQGKNRPDYVLLFAWAFLHEIKERNPDYLKSGGKFIIPLPSVKIVSK